MSGEALSMKHESMKHDRRGRAIGLALAVTALAAFPVRAQVQSAALPPNEVVIDNFAFGPKVLTVKAGSEVVWLNHDDEPHTIVASGAAKLFRSPALDTGDKFSFVLKEPGTYTYYCSVHPHMTGTIVVE